MKKLLTISLLMGIILLTGCEKNRLVCTIEEESVTDVKSETKYIFTFNEETIKDATMTTELTLTGSYNNDAFISNYQQVATSTATEYNNTEGVSATVDVKKNVIILKVVMKPSTMSDEDIETYGLNLKKEDLKKELTNVGYTCK